MSCLIKLDTVQGQYNAGDVITGRVCCSFRKSKNIRSIELKLKGKERNSWSVRRGDGSTTYSGKNKFLRVINTLQNEGTVGPGSFEYPFTFQLPHDIPGTYTGPYGGIFYSLKAKVDRPFKIDYTDKQRIVVVSLINFNLMKDQLHLKPVYYSIDDTFCGWCCGSGCITMDVHLEKTAFVVGEVANVGVDVNNMSSEYISSVSIWLKRIVVSKVTSPREDTKSKSTLLATMGNTGVGAHRQKAYNFPLVIPEPAQFVNFGTSKLFSQKTTLKVIANIDGCHTNMKIKLDVTLGHIPIQDNFTSVPPRYNQAMHSRDH